nr:hypothetical protein [Tanacetum cinerariifolium]
MMLLNGSKSRNGDEHQPKLSNLFKNFDYNGGGRWWLKGGDGREVLQAFSLKNKPFKGFKRMGCILDFLKGRSCTSERVEVYYECMEPFKSLMCLWVRSKSKAAIWLEKVVTPLIDSAIKGFAAASAILKPEHLKVDKARYE